MSEKTLSELVETRLEMEDWRAYRHEQQPWIALFDARIRRAETAERVANAVERWRREAHAANWQTVVNCLHGYDLAKEAVRKLEEGT